MFLFQQFAGINAVVYFSTQVFRSAGITSDVAASALVGAANVIGKNLSLFSTRSLPFLSLALHSPIVYFIRTSWLVYIP